MTLEEAKKVAKVVGNADGGCSHCVHELSEILCVEFPEFEWVYSEGEVVVKQKE